MFLRKAVNWKFINIFFNSFSNTLKLDEFIARKQTSENYLIESLEELISSLSVPIANSLFILIRNRIVLIWSCDVVNSIWHILNEW